MSAVSYSSAFTYVSSLVDSISKLIRVAARGSSAGFTRNLMEKTISVWCQIRLETSTNPDGNPDVSSLCLILRGNVTNRTCAIVSFLLEYIHQDGGISQYCRPLTNPEPLAHYARQVLFGLYLGSRALISLERIKGLLTLEVFECYLEVFFPN